MADEMTAPKVKTADEVGNGMSKREAKRIRMGSMSASEKGYLRRKAIADKAMPLFRFIILFGLGFIIMYPLIYMISCAFREKADMSAIITAIRRFMLPPSRNALERRSADCCFTDNKPFILYTTVVSRATAKVP